jgi:autoinducer 2 (AI-2) kinase
MAGSYVLTLDLGSSGLRAHVVEIGSWRILTESRRPYRILRSTTGLAFSSNDLHGRILDCLAEAVRTSNVASSSITSVSVAAQRGGMAFLNGPSAIYLAPNRDVRAVFEGAALDDAHPNAIYATTGHLPSMFFAPAKLRWWREHHPRRAGTITSIASLGAWAVCELTGVLAETLSTLTELGLADVRTGQPARDLLAKLGVPIDLLSSIVSEGAPTAGLALDAARTIGIPSGTPLYLAGPDAQVAALGSGTVEPGDTAVIAGWSAPVQRVTAQPTFDDRRRTWVIRGQISGTWASEANPGDTGAAVDLIRRLLGRGMSPQRFDRLAATAPPTDLPVIASWGPRALDLSNPGMTLGGLIVPSPVTYEGLAAGTVARATLENIAFAVRECTALLNNVCGPSNRPLVLAGGMGAGDTFASLLANALGRAVLRQDASSTAVGSAMVATLSRGQLLNAAIERRSAAQLFEPSAAETAEANERYERWLTVRDELDRLSEKI